MEHVNPANGKASCRAVKMTAREIGLSYSLVNAIVFCAFVFCVIGDANAMNDYCLTNTFVTNNSLLHFSKEVSTKQYSVVGKLKSLHCCAKGYSSIEWYKDDLAYPWPSKVSTFVLYPREVNQTIYTQHSADTDRGNYTCVVRNETHMHMHTVTLVMVEKPPPSPRATFTPKDQWVELGAPARVYCEAFVGRINLPDARSEVYWKRIHPNGSVMPQHPKLPQEVVTREEEQILGAYLIISNVKSDDYGQYVCTVANQDSFIEIPIWLHHKSVEDDQIPAEVPWKSLCLSLVGILLCCITLSVLYIKFGMQLALKCRYTSSNSSQDDKEYDVVVVYTEIDARLTLGELIPKLQNKYFYNCINCQLPNDISSWSSAVGNLCSLSRCMVVVLSPSQYTPHQLTGALSTLHAISPHTSPVVILLQELPNVQPTAKDSNGTNLLIMLKRTQLVRWRYLQDKHFWRGLRLSIPPPAASQSVLGGLRTCKSQPEKQTEEHPA